MSGPSPTSPDQRKRTRPSPEHHARAIVGRHRTNETLPHWTRFRSLDPARDLLYDRAGNDTIYARDGQRDRIDRGPAATWYADRIHVISQ
jgi:hypothetical protein